MKLLPNVALALMLSLGATAMVAAPATAQKNKKDDKAEAGVPKLTASPAFGKPAQEVKKALDAKDFATAEAKLAIADPLATTDDDRYFANIFRLNIASEKKDNATLATALDALIVNPKTPPADLPAYNFVRGTIAIEAKQNEQAIPFLLKARELGYAKTDLSVSLAQAYGSTNRTKEAIAELDKAVETETAAGRTAPESWYAYAVSNSYAGRDVPTAEAWLVRQLKAYPKVATWRTAVNNFRKVTDPTNTKFTKAQTLDLYRTMRGTKVLSDPNDYYGYVQAALDSGLPWESAAVIDEGRAAGKIPSGDADIARVYTAAQAAMKSEVSAANAAGKSKPSVAGDIYYAAGDYAKAAESYTAAAGQAGADANTVNMHLGMALANLGRKDEAKAAFAKVTAAPLSQIAHLWTIWLDSPPLA
jgi:tetratricopeptide (TPR) repeat protein